MLKSNLIEAIKTLTPKEMKEFGELVSSPFFNKNKNVIKLYEVIKKYYPELESEKLSKEHVFSKLFPGEAYKDNTMRLLMFYLYEVLEKFIAYERYRKNEFAYRVNLLAEFNERNLFKDFEKNYEETKKFLTDNPVRDEHFYMNSFNLANEYFSFLAKVHLDKYEKFLTKESVEDRFSSLTYTYLIRVLSFYCASLNTYHVLNIKFNNELFESILSTLKPDLFVNVPLIRIYYNAVMALLKPEEENFFYELKKLVLENESTISQGTLLDLYINLENYCTRKVREGHYEFVKESFELYRQELKNDLFKTNGFMSSAFYRSIVNVGCKLGEHEWLHDFIERYKSELRFEERDSMYNFNMAILETDERKFEEALKYLSKVKTDELYLKMDVRMLQCRLYYELGWDDTLNSLLDAFKRTLANNKLMPEFRKLHYSNFLKFLAKINNMKHKADELDLDILSKQIEKEDNFYHKQWLLVKIKELEKDYEYKGHVTV